MFLTKNEIDKNLKWLEKHASAPVLYLIERDIKHSDIHSDRMAELWKAVLEDEVVKEILNCQNEDGSWFSKGPWGPRGYQRDSGYNASRPKFVTTDWILPFLGEIGFTREQAEIAKAVEYIKREVNFTDETPQIKNCCGLWGMNVWALSSVGMAGEDIMKIPLQNFLACQREDGGWLNDSHLADSKKPCTTKGRWPWDRSCAWGSYYAARTLYAARDVVSKEALHNVLTFLYRHMEKLPKELWESFACHGHVMLRELEMFSECGFDMEEEMPATILRWLKGFYHPEEGAFYIQGKPMRDYVGLVSHLYKRMEELHGDDYWKNKARVGKNVLRHDLFQSAEDDWLTFRLTKIAIKMQE